MNYIYIAGSQDMPEEWSTSRITGAVNDLNIPRDSRIIELNAAQDATLYALSKLGYDNLYGIDSRDDVYNKRFYTRIRYQKCSVENTHFPPGFFDCAISSTTAPHSADSDIFLLETARILKDGGLFLLTSNPTNIKEFVALAGRHGFKPMFKSEKLDCLEAGTNCRPIFLGLRLIKVGAKQKSIPKKVSIISYSQGTKGGINEYAIALSKRLRKEYAMSVEIVKSASDAKYKDVIIQEQLVLCDDNKLKMEIQHLKSKGSRVFVEIHDSMKGADPATMRYIQDNSNVLCRCNEMAVQDRLNKYLLMPLISYKDLPAIAPSKSKQICIGSMGYALSGKRIDEIVNLAKRLGVRAKITMGINTETQSVIKNNELTIKKIEALDDGREIGVYYKGTKEPNRRIRIKLGAFTPNEIEKELSECTHFVFAQKGAIVPSATMAFVKRLQGRPIISLDTFQAKQMQAIRVKILNPEKRQMIVDTTKFYIWYFMQVNKIHVKEYLIDVKDIIFSEPITKEFLLKSKELLPIKDEDGMDYLICAMKSS